ncbi:hypothetical protein [Rothia sp. LK2492]|uniref:hypothetical protein n=1 Tax=Rothia sp. LK2492 TaxID=3114370 RepID=UPI0034CF5D11
MAEKNSDSRDFLKYAFFLPVIIVFVTHYLVIIYALRSFRDDTGFWQALAEIYGNSLWFYFRVEDNYIIGAASIIIALVIALAVSPGSLRSKNENRYRDRMRFVSVLISLIGILAVSLHLNSSVAIIMCRILTLGSVGQEVWSNLFLVIVSLLIFGFGAFNQMPDSRKAKQRVEEINEEIEDLIPGASEAILRYWLSAPPKSRFHDMLVLDTKIKVSSRYFHLKKIVFCLVGSWQFVVPLAFSVLLLIGYIILNDFNRYGVIQIISFYLLIFIILFSAFFIFENNNKLKYYNKFSKGLERKLDGIMNFILSITCASFFVMALLSGLILVSSVEGGFYLDALSISVILLIIASVYSLIFVSKMYSSESVSLEFISYRRQFNGLLQERKDNEKIIAGENPEMARKKCDWRPQPSRWWTG